MPEWNKHLNVLIAADKYSPQTLKSVAFGELEELYIDLEDLSEIVEFVALGLAYSNAHKRLEALVEDVCDNNICALFNISRFRELMEENKHSRDNLYVRNFDLLRNKAGFRAIVENDGKIALKVNIHPPPLDPSREHRNEGEPLSPLFSVSRLLTISNGLMDYTGKISWYARNVAHSLPVTRIRMSLRTCVAPIVNASNQTHLSKSSSSPGLGINLRSGLRLVGVNGSLPLSVRTQVHSGS